MKHNITSLGQTTSNGTITSIFRLNMSKVRGPGKLKKFKHSELQWYKTKHVLSSLFNQDSMDANDSTLPYGSKIIGQDAIISLISSLTKTKGKATHVYKGAAEAEVLVAINENDRKTVPALVKDNEAVSPGYTTGATILVSRRDLDPLEYAAMAKVSTKKPLVMW